MVFPIKVKKFSRSKIPLDMSQIIQSKNEEEKPIQEQPKLEPIPEEPDNIPEEVEEVDDFAELEAPNFEKKQQMKKIELAEAKLKPKRIYVSKKAKEPKDELFDNVGSEILGKEKRILINKINQYKALFPEELKQFKIKKGATIEDLENAVSECDAIISTGNVENFMTDSILACVHMVEGTTQRTKYDISGLSEILRNNPQFHKLAKQLYIKYKVFADVPPETQMLLLVATSTWIALETNKKRSTVNNFLNQSVQL